MGFETLFMIMLMVICVMAWWANYSKRNKVYCSFTNVDKSMERRWIKMTSRYVIFAHKRYDVIPWCTKNLLWNQGIIGQLFPQRVPALDYTHASRFPIDPNTGKPAIISPEVRDAMNKEEWVKSYAKGFTPPTAKKQTFAQTWLPWISIALIAVVFFYVFSNNQVMSQALAELSNRVNAIAK